MDYFQYWAYLRRAVLAQENHFFLEAITIQESIISDRLISFLSRPTAPKILTRNRRGRLPSFGSLIKDYWREEFPNPLKSGVCEDLISSVDEWRITRNQAVHAIVKSEFDESSQSIDTFLQKAKESAEEGECLAREICKWCKKAKNG